MKAFQNFQLLTPTPKQNVNEIWLLTILQQLAINGNRGAQQEFSVSMKASKEIEQFQQEFLTWECNVKNNSIGLPESDKK